MNIVVNISDLDIDSVPMNIVVTSSDLDVDSLPMNIVVTRSDLAVNTLPMNIVVVEQDENQNGQETTENQPINGNLSFKVFVLIVDIFIILKLPLLDIYQFDLNQFITKHLNLYQSDYIYL